MGVDAADRSVPPPPRKVPWAVRLKLLDPIWSVLLSLVSGVFSGLTVAAVLGADPISTWRLDTEHLEAPGYLTDVEPGYLKWRAQILWHCRFVYYTPDEKEWRGVCYKWGEWNSPPTFVTASDPNRRPTVVVVKYSPRHPETSCILGTQLSMWGPETAIMPAAVTLVALLTLWVLWAGSRNARLLAVGELARANLISCRPVLPDGKSAGIRPFAQFRRSQLAPAGCFGKEGSATEVGEPSSVVLAAASLLTMRQRILKAGVMTFLACYFFFLCGYVVIRLIPFFLTCFPGPTFVGDSADEWTPVGKGAVAFMTLVFVSFLMHMNLCMLSAAARTLFHWDVVEGGGRSRWLPCTFEFTMPGGRVIRAEDRVTFSDRLGAGATEPVLYDPARPAQAMLVNGVFPAVRCSESGVWETFADLVPRMRSAFIVVVIIGGPCAGWFVWGLIVK